MPRRAGMGIAALALGGGLYLLRPAPVRPQPQPTTTTLFPGITYHRGVRSGTNPLVWHVLTVDLATRGLRTLVTPGEPAAHHPLRAQTTSQFLSTFRCQVAINGDWFYPWRSNSAYDYYPHENDRVSVEGDAISRGVRYANNDGHSHLTTLYLTRDGRAQVGGKAPAEVWNALGGHRLSLDQPPRSNERQPRTAVGVDATGRRLILLVADGRQKGYSEGATEAELALLLQGAGAKTALNLDGGGSATMVIQWHNKPLVLNSPIDQKQVGKERYVANHLGIFSGTDLSSASAR